jgi:hypothetical protein
MTPDSPRAEKIHLLLRALQSYLPYSLPLYRRLQFHLRHPNPPFAQVFDAFSPLSPLSQERLSSEQWLSHASKQESATEQIPWLCSHIDLSAAGQTQVWTFANWELPEIQTVRFEGVHHWQSYNPCNPSHACDSCGFFVHLDAQLLQPLTRAPLPN